MTNLKKSDSRNITIDFIRGVAILIVVFGHNIQYGLGIEFYNTQMFFDAFLFKLIYSFHMPLFALLSGYLFFRSMNKPAEKVLTKRLTSLLLPVLCWTILEYLVKISRQIISREFTSDYLLQSFVNRLVTNLWFLWAIFWCSLIVLLVEKVLNGSLLIYGLILLAALFVPSRYNFHLYFFMYPYFTAGFLFNKLDGATQYRRLVKKDLYALLVALAVFAFLFLFFNRNSYIYTTGIDLLGGRGIATQLDTDIYRWCIGFSGSIVVIVLCKMICDKRQGAVIKGVAHFGQLSLGIYVLNQYVGSDLLVKLTGNFSPSVFIWVIETIISIPIYVVAVEVIKRIPLARKLLLGDR